MVFGSATLVVPGIVMTTLFLITIFWVMYRGLRGPAEEALRTEDEPGVLDVERPLLDLESSALGEEYGSMD